MKRGFLFTVMTLLLLSSLFSLTGYYLVRSKSMQEIKTSIVADKLKYVISDIGKSYFDVLGIQFNTTERASGITTIKFNQMYTVPNTEDYNTKLLNYENFLENTYGSLTNTGITITDFNSQFRIMPSGTSFVAGNDLYVYTVNSADINNIFVQIILSKSGVFTSGAPAGDLGDNPTIHAIIKLADGTIALDETRQLAISEENSPFFVDIEGQRVDVYFGLIEQPGTLRIAPTLLSATVEKMEIGYSTTEDTYITVGSIIINPNIHDIIKQSNIILAK